MENPNLNYIKSMSGGDLVFEQRLINIIKTEFPIEKNTYFSNITSDNFRSAAEIVHKLKHKISILGLVKSYEVAVNYEQELLEGKVNMKREFEAILIVITNYLEQL